MVWLIVGLKVSALVTAIALVTLTGCCGIAIGLVISARSRTEVAAVSWVPMVLIPQLILAGLLKSHHALGTAGQAISNVVPARWGFEALLRTLYEKYEYRAGSELTKVCEGMKDCSETIKLTPSTDEVLYSMVPGNPGYPDMHWTSSAAVLLLITVLAYLIAHILVSSQRR